MSVMVAHQRRVGRVGSIPTYSKSSYGIVTDSFLTIIRENSQRFGH
jgi:hypothetical protein